VIGSIEAEFADYDIGNPGAGGVLPVDDHGIMEFSLLLGRG